MSSETPSEIVLRPVDDFHEVEQTEKPHRVTRKGRKVAGDIVQLLNNLEAYESPETPAETYLEARSGKYVRMLEGILDVAAQLGMFDLARVTLVDLLRMTKVGRAKADVNLGGKLREEHPLTHLTDEELKNLVSKPADG
jgi:hypothetical protein